MLSSRGMVNPHSKPCLFHIVWLALLLLFVPAQAYVSVQITRVEIASNSRQDKIILTFSERPEYTLFGLSNPDRVVIDISSGRLMGKVELPSNYSGKILSNIRSGIFEGTKTRIVFDLSQPATVSGQSMGPNESGGYRLQFTLNGSGGGSSQNQLPTRNSQQPFVSPSDNTVAPAKQATPAPPPEELSHNQLPTKKSAQDVKKPVIIIDAGHGGDDPGAQGINGVEEKDVTLTYAKALREELLKRGKYRVVLTRSNDRFILLRERVAIARRAGGDVFISLHADSGPERSTRGLSVYTLSEKASDAEAEALAQRENKADLISGVDLSHQSKDVTEILIDLVQRETMNKSKELAGEMVDEVGKKVTLLPNTHRFAGFAVLKAPDIPSILIELGFLSNNADAKLLLSEKYRRGVVAGIARGIDQYFGE